MRARSKYPFVVAEIGANHCQDLDRAIALVRAAKWAGCDAVKLQTYEASCMVHRNEQYRIEGGLWHGKTLQELYERCSLPWSWHEKILAAGREAGIPVFSTPFSPVAVDFLERLGTPMYKIASLEILDLDLIRKVTRTGKQVIISTGAATLTEIDEAVQAYRNAGGTQGNLTLLKCTSAYPAPAAEANLATMENLREHFDCKVGLSDHTTGIGVAIAAAVMGADLIEKHLNVPDAPTESPDQAFSIGPNTMASMVNTLREAIDARGIESFGPTPAEGPMLALRRTLHVVYDLVEGDPLTEHNVSALRPGNGLPPKDKELVLGMQVIRPVKAGEPLTWDLLRKTAP